MIGMRQKQLFLYILKEMLLYFFVCFLLLCFIFFVNNCDGYATNLLIDAKLIDCINKCEHF